MPHKEITKLRKVKYGLYVLIAPQKGTPSCSLVLASFWNDSDVRKYHRNDFSNIFFSENKRGNHEDNLKYYSQCVKFNLTEKGVQICTQINEVRPFQCLLFLNKLPVCIFELLHGNW